MRRHRFRLPALMLAAFTTLAIAQNPVYKYKDAHGNPVYTDSPPADIPAERMQVPTQPTKSSGALSESEKQLLQAADRRVAELNRANEDIVSSFNALRAAEARRDQGIEPQEGERQGRRLRPEYWDRRQALESDVVTARARLDDAIARRNALR